ncbi:MAG: peptide ABC transporter substrate-binding protein [Gemmatimonadota bacterium]|nr:peptide ABC transporter substrate-binding protein [Gemmatimonadota bacterium]
MTGVRLLALLSIVGCVACASDSGTRTVTTGGTLIIAVPADADALFPPVATGQDAIAVIDMLYDRLADPDSTLDPFGSAGFTHVLADGWTWSPDSLSIAFHIDPRARWHDGPLVTANDVRFSYAVYADTAIGGSIAEALTNVDSVSARDSSTATVWFKRKSPHAFYDATYQLRILPEHVWRGIPHAEMARSPLARNPVGSGRFRFRRWETGTLIEIVADTANYRGRPSLDRVTWTVVNDPSVRLARLIAGEVDLVPSLRPEQVTDLAGKPLLTTFRQQPMQVNYLLFNLHDPANLSRPNPIFADRAMRVAITMAVDNATLIHSAFDSAAKPMIGPLPRSVMHADTALRPIAFDRAKAAAALDAAGWRLAPGDSVRRKGAVPLRFGVMVPSSSTTRRRLAVVLQGMLKQSGIQVVIDQLDPPAMGARVVAKKFDAAMVVWNVDPLPNTLRQLWSSKAAGTNGTNYGSYMNPSLDAAMDSADNATGAHYSERWRGVYQTLIDDAPALYLFEPPIIHGLHRRIHPVGARPDAYWARLADWSIPPGERIARDRVGLGTAPR